MAEPITRLARVRSALTPGEWARAGGMTAAIIGLHVVGLAMLAAAVGGHYHITSTRKLVNDGKRPLSVGFFFSLGHSTIVFVMAVLLNFGIRSLDSAVTDDSSGLHTVTGFIGTRMSAIWSLPAAPSASSSAERR